MGGLSVWHLILILIIALVIFGPNRLPQLGKSLGEAIKGFKKGLNDEEIDVTSTSRREQITAPQQEAAQQAQAQQAEQDKNKV